MKIERVELKFGAQPGASRLQIDAPEITIFVGPNNSGKVGCTTILA